MFVLDVLSAVGVPLLLSGQSYKICLRGCVYIHINKYIHLHLYFFMLLSVPLLTTHGFFPLPFLYNSVVSQTNGNQIFSVVYFIYPMTHCSTYVSLPLSLPYSWTPSLLGFHSDTPYWTVTTHVCHSLSFFSSLIKIFLYLPAAGHGTSLMQLPTLLSTIE